MASVLLVSLPHPLKSTSRVRWNRDLVARILGSAIYSSPSERSLRGLVGVPYPVTAVVC